MTNKEQLKPIYDPRLITVLGAVLLAQKFNQPLWLEPIKEIKSSLGEKQ